MKKNRIIILLALVCMVLFAGTSFMNASANQEKQGTLLLLGDSVADGYLALADKYEADCYNLSMDGMLTSDLLRAITKHANEEVMTSAEVVAISIGGSDLLELISKHVDAVEDIDTLDFNRVDTDFIALLDDMEYELSESFAALREKNPDALVMVQTLYNPFAYWTVPLVNGTTINAWTTDYIEQYNDLLLSLASEYGFECIDVAEKFQDEGTVEWLSAGSYGNKSELSNIQAVNPLPSEVGYQAIYEACVAEAGEKLDRALLNYMEVSEFRSDDTYSYPTKDGYVFGGWYTDKDYTMPLRSNVTEGKAYAKFVDADVLSVKYQLTENVKETSSTTGLRLVTTVDSLEYRQVGFYVTFGQKPAECMSNTVYEEIIGYQDGNKNSYLPTVFSNESQFFMAYTITAIPSEAFTTAMEVVPVWRTLDGTEVAGIEKTMDLKRVITQINGTSLFSFDSTEELHKTRFRLDNSLGSIVTNENRDYIVQGEGSLQLEIQGRYDEELEHPKLMLSCGNASVMSKDFSNYKTISFDVYNCENKELRVGFSMSVIVNGKGISTPQVIYELSPNAWTTCNYEVGEISSLEAYSFDNVQSVNFSFMEHKQSKDDAMNTLYLDNLLGTGYETGETIPTLEYDLEGGLHFEKPEDTYLIFGPETYMNRCDISRVSYDEENIISEIGTGEYGIKGNVTDSIWPMFSIRFPESLMQDMLLTAKVYVCKEEYPGDTYSMLEGTIDGALFNEWMYVSVPVSAGSSGGNIAFNFDDFSDPIIGHSRFSGQKVVIYLDNVRLTPIQSDIKANGNFYEGVSFETAENVGLIHGWSQTGVDSTDAIISRVPYEDAGIPALTNGDGYALKLENSQFACPKFIINFGELIPAGTTVTFKAYAVTKKATSRIARFESHYSTKETYKDFEAGKWVDIKFTLKEDTSELKMWFNYEVAGAPFGVVYIDNIKLVKQLNDGGSGVGGSGSYESMFEQ